MLPPFRAPVSEELLPELRSLAIHNQEPRSTLAEDNPPERVRSFDMWIKLCLHHGFYCTAYNQPLARHIQDYNCLNTQELQKLYDTIIAIDIEIQDGYQELSEAQNVYQYARMLLRSSDPDVIRHRKLLKRQLKYSRERCVDLKFVSKHYNKHIGKIWEIYSREIKRTCDFQDAEARESE